MKVQEITKQLYQAIFNKDKESERLLWIKALKKSLKGKKTQAIR